MYKVKVNYSVEDDMAKTEIKIIESPRNFPNGFDLIMFEGGWNSGKINRWSYRSETWEENEKWEKYIIEQLKKKISKIVSNKLVDLKPSNRIIII